MSRLQRQALRALIAALLLWAAPTQVSAAPVREVPVWVVAERAPSPSPSRVVVVRAATAPVARKQVASRPTEPSLPAPPPRAPAYLLYCALLR